MLFLVCYDVARDRDRDRLAKRLEMYGLRVQKSVFECILDAVQRDQLLQFVERTIDAKTDSVRLYPMTDRVREGTIVLGSKPAFAIDDDWFVV